MASLDRFDQDATLAQTSGKLHTLERRNVRQEKIGLRQTASQARPPKIGHELPGPGLELRDAVPDLIRMLQSGQRGGLARTGKRAGVIGSIPVPGDRLRRDGIAADAKTRQTVGLGRPPGHQQVFEPRNGLYKRSNNCLKISSDPALMCRIDSATPNRSESALRRGAGKASV
jgi:hypothetical protein